MSVKFCVAVEVTSALAVVEVTGVSVVVVAVVVINY